MDMGIGLTIGAVAWTLATLFVLYWTARSWRLYRSIPHVPHGDTMPKEKSTDHIKEQMLTFTFAAIVTVFFEILILSALFS